MAELGWLAGRLVISQPSTLHDGSPDRDGTLLVLDGEVVFPKPAEAHVQLALKAPFKLRGDDFEMSAM